MMLYHWKRQTSIELKIKTLNFSENNRGLWTIFTIEIIKIEPLFEGVSEAFLSGKWLMNDDRLF